MTSAAAPRSRPPSLDDDGPGVVAVPRREWRDALWSSDLPPTDRLVALAYAEHAAADPARVWVTRERLLAMTALSESGAKAALRRLRDAGWLTLTEPARQHISPRYALTLPSAQGVTTRPSEGVAQEPSAPQRVTTRPPEGVAQEPPEPQGVTSSTPGGHQAPPNQKHNQQRMHAGAAPLVNPPARPTGAVAELEDVIRGHRLALHLPPGVVTDHAHALAASRWDAPTLRTALDGEDFTHARGPGLLRATLDKFANNLRPERTPAAARASRCARHGTAYSTFCGACRADVRAGDLAPEDASGDLPPEPRTRFLQLA